LRTKWLDFRDRRKALKNPVHVLQDQQGIRFVLYPWDKPNLLRLVRRVYDVAEFQAIPKLVKPGDVACDIGANAGVYSVLLSRLCGRSGRVWAFEPVPDTYWRLRETLALNRCDNVLAVQAAIADTDGTATMNLFEPRFSEWNSLGKPSMLKPNGRRVSPRESVEVPSHTLDEFCDEHQIERVHFLKVDVEGFELSVFRGAERLLAERRIDFICFEISKDPLKGAGVRSRDVFRALEIHGYKAYRFDTVTGIFQGPIQDTPEEWINFFASHKDLSKIVELASDAEEMQKR
jgi:FkbM family methyltransferase